MLYKIVLLSDHMICVWFTCICAVLQREEIVAQREQTMPFLHGFRRIVYEYQPLVDAVMGVLGTGGENQRRSANQQRFKDRNNDRIVGAAV